MSFIYLYKSNSCYKNSKSLPEHPWSWFECFNPPNNDVVKVRFSLDRLLILLLIWDANLRSWRLKEPLLSYNLREEWWNIEHIWTKGCDVIIIPYNKGSVELTSTLINREDIEEYFNNLFAIIMQRILFLFLWSNCEGSVMKVSFDYCLVKILFLLRWHFTKVQCLHNNVQ